MHAERLAAHLAGQVERLLRQPVSRQLQGIGRHTRLQRLLDLGRRSEEAIGRRQSIRSTMRTLKVIMVHEQTDTTLGVSQIDEDCALDTLPPQRAPEAFDLSQRLWPPRLGHHLSDAALVQLLAEGALATPGDVLAAVVRQNLLGRPIGRDGRAQYLQHQGRRLTGVQAIADQEAAVIVHKSNQIDPPILPFQDECE